MSARTRKLILILTAAPLAAVIVFTTGPRAPRHSTFGGGPNDDHTIRGAFHIHTTRSDGALAKREVAAAAARAGLQFAVFTDHGTGDTAPDPAEYMAGVLCIDGVEISTNGGHYIALDIPAAPYPLGGDAAAVAEDVARLGGFGVAAHPVSSRAELAWSAWDVPIDGLEWLNADSEWRDEGRLRLARGLLDYLWRPAGALATLLDRPVAALGRWDDLGARRQIVGLAGHDAHGGLGAESGSDRGRKIHLPSYDASFRTFSIHAVLGKPLTRDAATDARLLLDAIRRGAVFTAIDAVAAPARLEFHATRGSASAMMGQRLTAGDGPARFTVRAVVPAGARTILKRNGVAAVEKNGGDFDHETTTPGTYRVEIEVPGAPGTPPIPWVVSNPIYWLPPDASGSPSPSATPARVHPLTQTSWRVESDPGSAGTISSDGAQVRLSFRLKDLPRGSQFVALVADLTDVPVDIDTIALRGRAERPVRISVQLRFSGDGEQRWTRSLYLDQTERDVYIPIAQLRHAVDGNARSSSTQPTINRATSLLFVIDLINAAPGAQGSLTLRDVALAKQ